MMKWMGLATRSTVDNLEKQLQYAQNRVRTAKSELDRMTVSREDLRNQVQIRINDLSRARVELDAETERAENSGNIMAEYMTDIIDMKTCPCPACRLARKFPDYVYIKRVVKAVARGDAD